ncbi:hypothetical protein MC885_003336 [Smutsia gigantea]|nr:hypothetical protein MC885_003336 [Smutsia gigantea]
MECSKHGSEGQDHIHLCTLNLVDLAGNERQNKAGPNRAEGIATQSAGSGGNGGGNNGNEKPKETSKIHLSLSALGNMTAALADSRALTSPTGNAAEDDAWKMRRPQSSGATIYLSLQQEVEVKTKKLKKLYAKLQVVNVEIQDQHEYACVEQDLEEAQNERSQELKLKY